MTIVEMFQTYEPNNVYRSNHRISRISRLIRIALYKYVLLHARINFTPKMAFSNATYRILSR